VLIYCVRAYLFDADILLRSQSVPVDVPNEFAQSRTNFVHLGEGIICLVMSVVLPQYDEFRIFVATFKVSRAQLRKIPGLYSRK
jgi:hypothetical protein